MVSKVVRLRINMSIPEQPHIIAPEIAHQVL